MSKKTNILVINGKSYDSRTGVLLSSHTTESEGGAKIVKKHKSSVKQPAKAIKPVAAKKPRQPAKNVNAHAPSRSKTLMRKVVVKPPASLKRQTKVQSHVSGVKKHSSGPSAALSTSAKKIDHRLSTYAHKVNKSPMIQRFSSSDETPAPQLSTSAPKPSTKPSAPKPYSKKHKPQTTAELLEYAIAQATSHEQPVPSKKSRNPLKRKT